MDKELDDRLVEEFPNLYRNRYGDPMYTCMVWGFPGNGWFQLIYDLSAKLEKLILQIPEPERELYCAAQCKEKFGGLRFYMDGATDEMQALIREAENLSWHICEECGAKGERRGGGWIKVLCDEHAKPKPVSGAPKQVGLQDLHVVLGIGAEETDDGDT